MPEPRIRREFLPASKDTGRHWVLLHGWSCNREIWRPLLAPLRRLANITLVDWWPPPTSADAAEVGPGPAGLEATLDGLLAELPSRFLVMGWSLGGQLAAALAERAPERVQALVTLASNPCFVEQADWPGLSEAELQVMAEELAREPRATLRRFDALQARGGERVWLRYLHQCRREQPQPVLQTGLQWLRELDLRPGLARLDIPQLHLLGDADALVPAAVAPALQTLLGERPEARVVSLPGCGHLFPLQATEAMLLELQSLLPGEPDRPADEPAPISKQAIAASFSRAAPHYDSVARLQRAVGEQLLARLPAAVRYSRSVVDLGCGTGYFRGALQQHCPDADYLGLDIAPGMLAWARQQDTQGSARWVVGDAEALPLATGSVDLLFSSLALQWCYRPRLLLAELARVLAPGGRCLFSTLGPATLGELRSAWAGVDDAPHVNRFLPLEDLQRAAQALPGVQLHTDVETRVVHHQAVGELLRELKTLGAHNMNSGRSGGLTPRTRLAAMLRAYERLREARGVPATWEVIYATLELT